MNHMITLSEYCTSVRDGTHDSPKQTDEGKLLITSKHISDGSIDFSNAYKISVEDFNKINKRSKVEKWDLLMTMIGTVGRLYVVNDNPDYAIKNLVLFKIGDEWKSKYLYYYLSSQPVQDYFEAVANGTSQHFVGLGYLRKFKIPTWGNDTLNKIKILNNYDKLIENNNKRIQVLEDMAESLYKEWFVRFRFPGYENVELDNGFPKGWEIKRIMDFGEVRTGKTPSTEIDEYYGNDYLFIKTPDMHSNIIVLDSNEKLSELGNMSQRNCLLPPYSIMVSCIGTGGVAAINYYPAHTNQQINSIILSNKMQMEWLYFQVKSMKETIIMFGNTGSTMTNLSKGKFQKLKLLKPTDDLIEKFSNIVKPLLEQEICYLKQNQSLIKQRDLLLPRLMSGKLSVEGKEVI